MAIDTTANRGEADAEAEAEVVAESGDCGDDVKVHLISLGCPKNLVDSEMILGRLGVEGFVITPDAEEADVIVVNTCGFVESAKEESIQTILEACEIKRHADSPKRVVVAGCLGQRYGKELRREIPEVDAIVGLGEYGDLGQALRELVGGRRRRYFRVSDPTKACNAEVGRFRLTPAHYGYLRISEGCDNPCTFCAIPAIRGRFRSKSIPMVEAEARELVASGADELVIISQDTTSYGVDLDGSFQLARLLEHLAAIDGVRWIRLLYAYPAFFTDEMIGAMASIEKVVKYVDMPLQHISNTMLRHMGRRLMEEKTRALLDRLRQKVPGIYLRTTFIVGFPGEDDREFEVLRDFVRDFGFERLGVFAYSAEEGTPAASFAGAVPDDVKAARLEELMLLQQGIAFRKNTDRLGEVVEVVVDSVDDSTDSDSRVRARSFAEAPEIDPVLFVRWPAAGGAPRGVASRGVAPRDRAQESIVNGSVKGRTAFRELQVAGASACGPSMSPARQPRVGDRYLAKVIASREYDLVCSPQVLVNGR